jgi:transcriptional regulator with XRE-family HTH domain
MGTKLDKIMRRLPAKRRAKVEDRAAQLIAEEHTLRDLRKAREMTQDRLAELLNIGQDSISRLEQRTDLHISTLKQYITALGGGLRLIAEFPDRPPIELTGLGALEEEKTPPKRRSKRSGSNGDSRSHA